MPFQFSIPAPAPEEATQITLEPGSSIIFVGANGGGKTRLAAHLENALGLKGHRISAHRALMLNPTVPKISERTALSALRTGISQDAPQAAHRPGNRWGNREAIALLNDFDFLIQALFAEQSNKALKTHQRARAGDHTPPEPTKFERLVGIWDRLLPHRQLEISGDNITVLVAGSDARYSASDMSDGERAIFYMIGQTLAAEAESVLIFDEPELHVHRSIMAKLWDELEACRQDCAFVFITHDLDFAAARAAQKYVIREYHPAPWWSIEPVPENTGFDEAIATLILGSRRPVLFVEGTENSLDVAIYRCSYPDWTVIPRGSCEEVIHSVVTMRRNKELTRVTCSGIVDADDYGPDDIAYLNGLGIAVLPVSEIENVCLLPTVSRAIADAEGYQGPELEARLNALKSDVFETLKDAKAIEAVVARYVRRRIDRLLKKIDLSEAGSIADIAREYGRQTAALDVAKIAQQAKERIEAALRAGDLASLLKNYDNKALLALAAGHLKKTKLVEFEGWITRILRNNKAPVVVNAIRAALPTIHPQ